MMPTETELADRLSERLTTDLSSIAPSDELLSRSLTMQVTRHSRSAALAMACCAAAAAVGLAAAFGGSAPGRPPARVHPPAGDARATASLLGRHVRLPSGYRLMSTSTSSCQSWLASLDGTFSLLFAIPVPLDEDGVTTTSTQSSDVVSVPSADQGCIHATESTSYALPPGTSGTSPIMVDDQGTPTTIDGDYAEYAPISVEATNADGSSATTDGTAVYVRVPAANGQYQLVEVFGWAIPQSEVIQLTAQALS